MPFAPKARRRGHRETPIVIGIIAMSTVLLAGFAHLARANVRARKPGAQLDTSERLVAFAQGCALALGAIVAVVLLAALCVGIIIWRDNRRNSKP